MSDSVKKPSEFPIGSFMKMGKLIMYRYAKDTFFMALPNQSMARGNALTADLKVFIEATKQEFIDTVNKTDNTDNWYGIALKETILHILNQTQDINTMNVQVSLN